MRTICLDCILEDGIMEIKDKVDPMFLLALQGGQVEQVDSLDGIEDIVRMSIGEEYFQQEVWDEFMKEVNGGRIVGIWTWSIEVDYSIVVLLD